MDEQGTIRRLRKQVSFYERRLNAAEVQIEAVREVVSHYVNVHHTNTAYIHRRLRDGWTQQRIADDLGITQAAVSKRQVDSKEWPLLDALAALAAPPEVASEEMLATSEDVKPETFYWHHTNGAETLFSEIDDAVQDFSESCYPNPLPTTLEIQCYKPRVVDPERVNLDLEEVLEDLDEEYGTPEGDATKPTPGMEQAATEFRRAIVAEYEVWLCDRYSAGDVSVVNLRVDENESLQYDIQEQAEPTRKEESS